MTSTKTPSLNNGPLEIRIIKNSDGTYRIIVNGMTVVASVAYRDLAEALSKKFGWGASKQFIGASNERPSAAGNIEVKRDYVGGGFLVTKTVGHEVKRYRFSDEAKARQFAAELSAGTYPAAGTSTSSTAAVANEGQMFVVTGPTVALKRFFAK